MNVCLRVDSSFSIGSGHIMRCLSLAKSLNKLGAQCTFISKKHSGNIIEKIGQSGFDFKVIAAPVQSNDYVIDEKLWLGGNQLDDAKEFVSLINEDIKKPDIIVVDHYSLDEEWEEIVKQYFPSARLVVIDDLCNRKHRCDLLIDQTYKRKAEEYALLTENNCKVLAGTQHALINPLFQKLRKQSINKKSLLDKPRTLMITMGGVDAQNVTGTILDYLELADFTNFTKITVILGIACPHASKIRLQAQKSKYYIDVLSNVTNMAELMLEHDCSIGAMGGTTWERCSMAQPAVNIAIANNQRTIVQNLLNEGAIVLDANNFSQTELCTAVENLIMNYQEQRILAMNICDGLGIMRDVQEIIPLPAKDSHNVTLRLATEDDIDFVYQLQCEPQTRRFARNPEIPEYVNHVSWMKDRLSNVESVFYIIEHDGPCGVLRLDPIQHISATHEISILLTTSKHGKGIATAAIKRALMLHTDFSVLEPVLPEDYTSHKLFNSIGFKKISSSEYISERE